MTSKYPNNLRKYRIKRKLTQQDVIAALGHKTASRLSAWEQGLAVPSLDHLLTLAHLYRVRVEDLYGPYKRKLDYARKKRRVEQVEVSFTPSIEQEEKTTEQLIDELAQMLVEAYFYEKRQVKNKSTNDCYASK